MFPYVRCNLSETGNKFFIMYSNTYIAYQLRHISPTPMAILRVTTIAM